jgi:F0F1-type ATP synthase assembly protein I
LVVEGNASRAWLKLAGLGFELAGSIAGGAVLGWWIDRQAGTSPTWLAILAGVGAVGGLYNLIRTALAASRSAGGGSTPESKP